MNPRHLMILGLMCGLMSARTARAQGDPLERLDPERNGPGGLIVALEELERYRPSQAVAPATALLAHPEPDVARTAAWLLRRMGQGDSGASVAGGVLASAEATVEQRRSAALALGELRSVGGADALRTALAGDAEPSVRLAAAEALGALARAGSSGALTAAASGDADPAVRTAAVRALVAQPDSSEAPLLGALADSEAAVRREACWGLGRRRVVGAVGNLLRALQSDTDCSVQAAAAWALGRLGDSSAIDALRAAEDGRCRLASQAAASALVQLESD